MSAKSMVGIDCPISTFLLRLTDNRSEFYSNLTQNLPHSAKISRLLITNYLSGGPRSAPTLTALVKPRISTTRFHKRHEKRSRVSLVQTFEVDRPKHFGGCRNLECGSGRTGRG